ncbi:helix-turn-helix domain-containing protein [Aquirufa aurantiipilula]|uniref:helix-turn-helix domain-containing protein n=1 Tax=Aquirufa aurantiipilula TaxID=2696561 RepID=UPI001CAA659A|nr:AraC family transcriptional regulator [Aquirufa aurantiipilula]MBZ1325714.1 AraC family transcriptional regulator [Aquirufa aurantiipilula]
MEKLINLEEFYRNKFNWVPENLKKDWGHFNVFALDPYIGIKAKPTPYKRRDFYKITLVKGQGRIHYANKFVDVKKQAIVFSNPMIPYKWEGIENFTSGYFCIFNQDFFKQFGNINSYSIYQPQGVPVFELSDESYAQLEGLYRRMMEEISSDYIHKYDVLRNLTFEAIHSALKLQPANASKHSPVNANQRISMLFLELLERQFPIEETHPVIQLKNASDFANQLSVHVNHLNRAIKETTQKTTSQIIAERIVQEAKVMLKFSDWNISEIAFALGFNEVSYFNNFFKKNTSLSPLKFRNSK